MESPTDDEENNPIYDKSKNTKNIHDYENLSNMIQINLKNHSDKPFLGSKIGNSYKWLTYEKVGYTIMKLKNYFEILLREKKDFFTNLNFNHKEYRMVGIFTNSRPENLIFMLTMHVLRMAILPIFNTIHETNLKNILIHSELRSLIVDNNCLEFLINKQIFESQENNINVKNILLIDTKGNGLSELFQDESNEDDNIRLNLDIKNAKIYLEKLGINLTLFTDVLNYEEPENFINRIDKDESLNVFNNFIGENEKDDIILLNYTTSEDNSIHSNKSYTFNDTKYNISTSSSVYPSSNNFMKGVLTSEKSFITTLYSLIDHKQYQADNNDTYYSLTSTADIPEYLNNLIIMKKGMKIGYFSGQPIQIFDDIKTLQPSILYMFPRVLSKIAEALQSIINKLDDAKKNMIINAIKIKINCLLEHGEVDHHIWDKLLFKKIKDSMGGNIRLIMVGGGHLSPYILHFLKICLNTTIIEIYGVTESCGIITLSNLNSHDNKYIGKSIDPIEISLISNKQLGCWDPDCLTPDNYKLIKCGEICVKGNLFSGYYKSKSREEMIDDNGYFHTGDYAALYQDVNDNSENMRLIEKLEDIMKTSAGFLISPSFLEDIYTQSEYISNISIIQDDELNLVGIVVINKDKLKSICNAKKFGLSNCFNCELDEGQIKQRKGSINTQYKTDKSRFRNSHSIHLKSTNPQSLCDNNTPSHSNHITYSCHNEKSYAEILSNPNENKQLKSEILKSLKLIWAENKLRNHEMIDDIYILSNSLLPSIENGLLSSKMKLNRQNLKMIYRDHSHKDNKLDM